MTMQDGWSRRRFFGATVGTLMGLGLFSRGVWLGGRDPAAGTGEKGDEERASLPPKVVGLRTSGGNFRFDPVGLRIEPGTLLSHPCRRVSTHKPKAPWNHSHAGKYSAGRAHELSATPHAVHRHLAPPLALSA